MEKASRRNEILEHIMKNVLLFLTVDALNKNAREIRNAEKACYLPMTFWEN